MKSRVDGAILVRIALCATVAACSRTDSAATTATTTAAAAGSGPATAFEVVTVDRPESVEAFHKLYKFQYDMCANTRTMMKLPPPAPMKQPPADFISERRTYLSDGKDFLIKTEYFAYEVKSDEPAFTCETAFVKTTQTELIRDGKSHLSYIDETGQRGSEPPVDVALPRQTDSGGYTEPKIVNGHAVKCMAPLPEMKVLTKGLTEALPKQLTEGMAADLCIADLKPGTLTDNDGRAIVLAARVNVPLVPQGAILTEPVSLKIGLAIDKAVFDAAAAP